MDVIFFVPKSISPTKIPFYGINCECYPSENLGIGYLFAALNKFNISAEIYDFNFEIKSEKEILNLALNQSPKIIGITAHQYSFLHAKQIATLARELNFDGKIIIGGQFPSLASKFVFNQCQEIDHILAGEADETIVEYTTAILNGINPESIIPGCLSKNTNLSKHLFAPKINNLDKLPIPYRYGYTYLKNKNIPSISSSRGCPYGNCTFCSTAAYYKKIYGENIWRYRSSDSIYYELKDLYIKHQCNYFVFADETVFNTEETENRLPTALSRLNSDGIKMNFLCDCRASNVKAKIFTTLKQYGLKRVFIGFETNNTKYLNFITKGTTPEENERAVSILKQLDIEIMPGLIPFYPYATLESVKKDFYFMVEVIGYNALHKYVKRLLPEINTPFFVQLLKQNNLFGQFPIYKYKFYDEKVQKLYNKLNSLIFDEKVVDCNKLYSVVMETQ